MSTDARAEGTEQKKTVADRTESAWFAPTADDPAWRKTVRDEIAAAARKRGDKVLGPSLWPSKHTRRVRWLRWRWWVEDLSVTNTLAAARVYSERTEAAKRKAESTPHPFFARCEHGVQFLDECEACPDGCPVAPEAGAES